MRSEQRTIASFERIELLDSRGKPALRVSIKLDGRHAIGSVPPGGATEEHEAQELWNADPAQYLRKGVLGAAANVTNVIASESPEVDLTHRHVHPGTLG
jgi:enolase